MTDIIINRFQFPLIKGDVDGDRFITENDAIQILRYLVDLPNLIQTDMLDTSTINQQAFNQALITPESISTNTIRVQDAIEILKYLQGNNTYIPEPNHLLPQINDLIWTQEYVNEDKLLWLRNNPGVAYDWRSNFINSAYFPFFTKVHPEIAGGINQPFIANMSIINENIRCTLAVPMDSYSIRYYYWDILDATGRLLERSEKIYSNWVEFYSRVGKPGMTFVGVLNIFTQDEVSASNQTSISIPANPHSAIGNIVAEHNKKLNNIEITWDTTQGSSNLPSSYLIERSIVIIDRDGNEIRELPREYLCNLVFSTSGQSGPIKFCDWKAGNGVNYRYYITPKTFGTSAGFWNTESVDCVMNSDSWSIYFVKELEENVLPSSGIQRLDKNRFFFDQMYGEKHYSIEAMWFPMLDIPNQSIEHNLGKVNHIGYSGMPTTLVGNENYIESGVRFKFGEFICPDSVFDALTQTEFDYWNNLIKSKMSVLIKDFKGNVWFAEIMSHTYEIENQIFSLPYNIDIGFTQTRELGKCVFPIMEVGD
jgi:hypothetical protein